MTIITDSLGDWKQLGEIIVSPAWQIFDVSPINCETFRITTTIVNQQDWDELKIRSAAYIQFYYAENSNSPKFYIPVSGSPVIREFPIPVELKNNGLVVRSVGCTMSHKYKNKYSLESFARWTLKLEALL